MLRRLVLIFCLFIVLIAGGGFWLASRFDISLAPYLALKYFISTNHLPVDLEKASVPIRFKTFFDFFYGKEHRIEGIRAQGVYYLSKQAIPFQVHASIVLREHALTIDAEIKAQFGKFDLPHIHWHSVSDIDFDQFSIRKTQAQFILNSPRFVDNQIRIEEKKLKGDLFFEGAVFKYGSIRTSDIPKVISVSLRRFGAIHTVEGTADLHNLVDMRLAPWILESAYAQYFKFLRKIKTHGQVKFRLDSEFKSGEVNLDLQSLEIPKYDIRIEKLKLKLPVGENVNWGSVQVAKGEYQGLSLQKIDLNVRLRTAENKKIIEAQSVANNPVSQMLWGGKIEIKDFFFSYDLDHWDQSVLLRGAMNGGPFALADLQKSFCVAPHSPIKGDLTIRYPRFELIDGSVHFFGDSKLNLFNGNAVIGDFHFYPKSQPEFKFGVQWQDLDLQAIGQWTKLGDIRGSLEGKFSDVHMILTDYGPRFDEYEFLIRGNERGGTPIRFYGRAVSNILEMLGTSSEDMAFFQKALFDLATGFRNLIPAKIQYMGFHARSDGEWTTLKTFDPEKKSGDHYLLFGGEALKIPLNTHGVYPLVVRTEDFQFWLLQRLYYFKGRMKDESSIHAEDKECIPLF